MQSLRPPPPPKKLQRTSREPTPNDIDINVTDNNNNNNPSLISKLHDEILFHIFTINSLIYLIPENKEDPANHPPFNYTDDTLFTTRRSSQVCNRWRTLLLASPTIWANSLDLRWLNQPNDKWRSEILRRTQNAPLSILITRHSNANRARAFVVTLLKHHWSRIRFLALSTSDRAILTQIRASLQWPAPALEHFRLRRSRGRSGGRAPPASGQPLFADCSPNLTFLRLGWIGYELSGAWMSNIRHLWLSGRTSPFTLLEMHRGLQNLPLIEELCIAYKHLSLKSDSDDDSGRLIRSVRTTICLPHLSDIMVMSPHVEFITHLLRYIAPSPKCRLIVSKIRVSDITPNETLLLLSEFFATFVLNSADMGLGMGVVSALNSNMNLPYMSLIHNTEDGFALRVAQEPLPSIDDEVWYMEDEFTPSLSFLCVFTGTGTGSGAGTAERSRYLNNFGMPIIRALSAKPEEHTSGITRLQLRLDKNAGSAAPAPAPATSTPESTSDGQVILDLLYKLGNITELHCNVGTLRFLLDATATANANANTTARVGAKPLNPASTSDTHHILFPRLTNLILDYVFDPEEFDSALSTFLSQRVAMRARIEYLEVRMDEPGKMEWKWGWGFLKGLMKKGLCVSWEDWYEERDYEKARDEGEEDSDEDDDEQEEDSDGDEEEDSDDDDDDDDDDENDEDDEEDDE